MPRNDQVTRVYRVLQLLEANPRGLTVKQLHSKLTEFSGVSDRTVRRDILALEEAGFPIVSDEADASSTGKCQIFKLQNAMKVSKSLVLTPGELLALYFARGALTPLKGTSFYSDLGSMFEKVRGLIDPKGQRALDEIGSDIQFEPTPKWALGVDPDVLETVRAACAEGHVLNAFYHSGKGKKGERRLGPQFLYFAQGSLYLVAEDLADHVVKVFAMPRFRSAEMTKDPYQAPRVDPEKFFERSFGVFHAAEAQEIVIRVQPPVAGFVKERRWHPSQQVMSLAGGIIEIKLFAGITPDLVTWVLGLGVHGAVVAPEELKTEVMNAAEKISAIYRAKKAA